ncbi:MAG: glycosyltransferase family 4 protein [Rhodocyclaceae bacterium]
MTKPARNVLHFSATDNEGGSGRSAYRIHNGLRELGWRSRMIVGTKVTRDPDVDTAHGGSRALKWTGYLIDKATRKAGLAYQWQPWGGRLRRHPWLNGADVIQLYNLHGGYFPIRLLPAMSRRAPLIWRLSDMWPMTGHCVYSGTCEKWTSGCGGCPIPGDYVELGIDTSAFLWRQKSRLYAKCDITIVAPSSWTERLARESPLLGRFQVRRIPNGLDTRIFKPIPRQAACEILHYDPAVKRILFVAHGLDDNPRKGGAYLMEALKHVGPLPGVELLLAGVGGESWENADLPIRVRRAGYVTDDRLMAALYSCADMIVVPSPVENLPNTLLEAMACGVPAVAFDTGGMADAVHDGVTGHLVRSGDAAALAAAIRQMLGGDGEQRARMGVESRRLIEREFSSEIQAERFAALYDEIIDARGKGRAG